MDFWINIARSDAQNIFATISANTGSRQPHSISLLALQVDC
jgi:hypothetical protein